MDFALNVYFDMALGVEVTEKIGDFWVSLLLNIRNLRFFEAGPSFAAIAMCIRKLII